MGNHRGSVKASGRAVLADRQREIVGVIFLLAATMVALSLGSFSPTDPVFAGAGHKSVNLMGLVGAYLADVLLHLLGVASFLIVGALVYGAVVAFSLGGIPLSTRKVIGCATLTLLGTVLAQVAFDGRLLMGHVPGGIAGEYMGGLLVSLLSPAGTLLLVFAGMVLGLIEVVGFSPARFFRLLGRGCRALGGELYKAGAWFGGHLRTLAIAMGGFLRRQIACGAGALWQALFGRRKRAKKPVSARELAEQDSPIEEVDDGPDAGPAEAPPCRGKKERKEPKPRVVLAPPVTIPPELDRREPLVVTSDPPPVDEPEEPVITDEPEKKAKRTFQSIRRDHEPEIVIPKPMEKPAQIGEDAAQPPADLPVPDLKDYKLPDLSLLDVREQTQTKIDTDKLHEYAKKLEEKLADYGVGGHVTKIMPGPVVTMYEYAPAAGVKVSKITNLASDLALALEAMSVRIIAPIPGRNVVGIEVSNKETQTVYLKEIIGHHVFSQSRSKLTIALGKDIEGTPTVTDLNKMPHLLVAGATGTGKSVALNAMITSILYRSTPEDVRFIMVDPKVLELSLYEDIPHLLLPVVTDPRKAQAALYWAVNEMERRIHLLHQAGVRNLDSYNKKVEQLLERGQANSFVEEPEEQKTARKVIVIDKTAPAPAFEAGAGGSPVEVEIVAAPVEVRPPAPEPERRLSDAPVGGWKKLPHIVIVIDELADLMMTSSREVEASIIRIAQKARAAGIHLIVATQRPSVNVITGMIKANLPARISFRVASKVDSRTILDQNGAEALLGNGDMLFHPPTSSQIARIHGALITEEEITRIVAHLKAQAKPVYDESILASAEEENEEGAEEGGEDEYEDALYDEAVQVVTDQGQASTSMVQRKLRIGYNRAARLIERMEREGIVGPADGARPREVLAQGLSPS